VSDTFVPTKTDPGAAEAARTDDAWWRDAVVYQIYPRSFADGDGDGMGDFAGITSKVPYLSRLGVDAVWISPFYVSPQRDAGYDVADYVDVDPRFGTLADVDAFIAVAHAAGIRVIVDLVPNHSSSAHPWFQAALASAPGSRERARYMVRRGSGPDASLHPHNWHSAFGGPPPGAASRQMYQSRLGLLRDARLSRNQTCWSELWLGTKSRMSLRPRAWTAASSRSKPARSPKIGSMPQ